MDVCGTPDVNIRDYRRAGRCVANLAAACAQSLNAFAVSGKLQSRLPRLEAIAGAPQEARSDAAPGRFTDCCYPQSLACDQNTHHSEHTSARS
ncbi:unnamed protein product, partial [Iphiclides podalirius]